MANQAQSPFTVVHVTSPRAFGLAVSEAVLLIYN